MRTIDTATVWTLDSSHAVMEIDASVTDPAPRPGTSHPPRPRRSPACRMVRGRWQAASEGRPRGGVTRYRQGRVRSYGRPYLADDEKLFGST